MKLVISTGGRANNGKIWTLAFFAFSDLHQRGNVIEYIMVQSICMESEDELV